MSLIKLTTMTNFFCPTLNHITVRGLTKGAWILSFYFLFLLLDQLVHLIQVFN